MLAGIARRASLKESNGMLPSPQKKAKAPIAMVKKRRGRWSFMASMMEWRAHRLMLVPVGVAVKWKGQYLSILRGLFHRREFVEEFCRVYEFRGDRCFALFVKRNKQQGAIGGFFVFFNVDELFEAFNAMVVCDKNQVTPYGFAVGDFVEGNGFALC